MAISYGASADYYDGSSSAKAAPSAIAIKKAYPNSGDGVYWINLPTVGPTQTYCLMDDRYDGGGWMMMLKATTGTTFNYDSSYWTTANTLNPTDLTRSNADAKFHTMNYFPGRDLMAIWPDITTAPGGSIPGTGNWTWLQKGFNGGERIAPTTFFSTVNRRFFKDAKTYDGWASGVFSSQVDIRFYGFNWTDNLKVRWGFGWNENGGGLYPNGVEGSDDVVGGIGNTYDSAGDRINCCQDTTGINRQARVEVYVR
jgi:hypothetical protein